ncbi:unnamed protein product, partial [marine sediment metagenome]
VTYDVYYNKNAGDWNEVASDLQSTSTTFVISNKNGTGFGINVTPKIGSIIGVSNVSQTFDIEGDCDVDGHDFDGIGGEDCDDTDDSIYPGADEIAYDGIDQNCSGSDRADLDGDGFNADCDFIDGPCAVPGGDDCNDGDEDINPGATESTSDASTCSDGLDNDCDEYIDWSDFNCGQGFELDPDYFNGTGTNFSNIDDISEIISPVILNRTGMGQITFSATAWDTINFSGVKLMSRIKIEPNFISVDADVEPKL